MKFRDYLTALLLMSWLVSASAQAPSKVTDGELELLPTYCKDTQGFRYGNASYNPSPRAAHWVALMGQGFWAMHHYCWARINMKRLPLTGSDRVQRSGTVTKIVDDLFYVVKNTKPDFVLLPEIYSTLAEAELLRNDPVAAFGHIDTARRLKPSYASPYQVWGNHLASIGKKTEARDFVKIGLDANPAAPELRELYRKLGGDPALIAVPPAPAAEPASAAASEPAPASATVSAPAASTAQ